MNCPKCKKEALWCENKELYGRNYGKSYMCYLCKDCDTYVGCHNNTKEPLGTMADSETRQWRMKTHSVLDPLWKTGKYPRKVVYQKLSKLLGYEVHVSQTDIQGCKKIIETIESNLST